MRAKGATDPLRRDLQENILVRIKKLRPGTSERLEIIEKEDGSLTDDPKEIASCTKIYWEDKWDGESADWKSWAKHIKDYIKRLPVDFKCDISRQEIRDVIAKSSNTSMGPDNIPFSAYRMLNEETTTHILKMIEYISRPDSREPPADFNSNLLYFIPKKSTSMDEFMRPAYKAGSLRPISVGNTFVRIFANVLRIPLMRGASEIMNKNAHGFIPDRYIVDGVVEVNRFLSEHLRDKKQSFLLFIDFQSAFSTLNPEFVRRMLCKIGFGREYVKVLSSLWNNITHVFPFKGEIFPHGRVRQGLKQGCPCSPLLFCYGIDILIERISKLIGNKDIVSAFADDILVGFSGFPIKLIRDVMRECDFFSKYSGVKVNQSKSFFVSSLVPNKTQIDSFKRTPWGNISNQIRETGEYLGVWMGRNVDRKRIFQKAMTKLDEALQKWWGVPFPPTTRILTANVFMISLFSYVGQFYIPDRKLSRQIQGKINRFVFRLKGVDMAIPPHLGDYGFKNSLKDINWVSIASILRNSFHEYSLGNKFKNQDMSIIQEGHKAINLYADMCGISTNSAKEIIEQEKIRKPKRVQSFIYKNILKANSDNKKIREFWEHRTNRWIDLHNQQHDNQLETNDLLIEWKKYMHKVGPTSNPKVHMTMFKTFTNNIATKARQPYKNFNDKSCVFCGNDQDRIEHWARGDSPNSCQHIKRVAIRLGLIDHGDGITIRDLLGLNPDNIALWRVFWHAVYLSHVDITVITWKKKVVLSVENHIMTHVEQVSSWSAGSKRPKKGINVQIDEEYRKGIPLWRGGGFVLVMGENVYFRTSCSFQHHPYEHTIENKGILPNEAHGTAEGRRWNEI